MKRGRKPKRGRKLKRGRKPREITECPHPDRRHYSGGMCRSCYMSWKYWNDDEYRKAKLEYGRKKALEWIRNKLKEDPKFNARRQMKFRKKHPDSFNFIMARYYWRKLSAEKKAELIRRFP